MSRNRKVDDSAAVVYHVEEETQLLLLAMDQAGVRIHNAYGSSFLMPVERTFITLEGVERYVNELNGNPIIRGMSDKPRPYIKVKQSKYADRSAFFNISEAIMYLQHYEDTDYWQNYRQLLILHELAHYLGGSGHGQRYREAYIQLIRMEMGEELARYMQIRLHEETQELNDRKKQEREGDNE